MTTIYYENDADFAAIAGQSVAVVGDGNQGRSWALNLRDSAIAEIVCILVPDDTVGRGEQVRLSATEKTEAAVRRQGDPGIRRTVAPSTRRRRGQ